LEKAGAFGCPGAKADLGFPEPSATMHDVSSSSGMSGTDATALVLGALGVVLGLSNRMRSKKHI
jgi:hypothetical protein